jgi:hypothetical protein
MLKLLKGKRVVVLIPLMPVKTMELLFKLSIHSIKQTYYALLEEEYLTSLYNQDA